MTRQVIEKIISNLSLQNVLIKHINNEFVNEMVQYLKQLIGPSIFNSNFRMWDGHDLDRETFDELIDFANAASQSSQDIKICMISSVEVLRNNIQNQFLKTLEESNDTIFILMGQTLETVLPTIKSRCLVLEETTNAALGHSMVNEKMFSLLNLGQQYEILLKTDELSTFRTTLNSFLQTLEKGEQTEIDFFYENKFFLDNFNTFIEFVLLIMSNSFSIDKLSKLNELLAKYRRYIAIPGANTNLAIKNLLNTLGDVNDK